MSGCFCQLESGGNESQSPNTKIRRGILGPGCDGQRGGEGGVSNNMEAKKTQKRPAHCILTTFRL